MKETSFDGRRNVRDHGDADRLKSAAAAVKSTFRAMGENTTFDGIRHLHRARGEFDLLQTLIHEIISLDEVAYAFKFQQ